MGFLLVQRDLVMSLAASSVVLREILTWLKRCSLAFCGVAWVVFCAVFCATEAVALTVMLLSLPLRCQQNCVDLTGTLTLVCSREKAVTLIASLMWLTSTTRVRLVQRYLMLHFPFIWLKLCRPLNSTIWIADCQIRRFGVQTVRFNALE